MAKILKLSGWRTSQLCSIESNCRQNVLSAIENFMCRDRKDFSLLSWTAKSEIILKNSSQKQQCSVMKRLNSTILPESNINERTKRKTEFIDKLSHGPTFKKFVEESSYKNSDGSFDDAESEQLPPYLANRDLHGRNRKVFIETYGCQMNNNDTEIAWSILKNAGYVKAADIKESDVILVMTCAIREGAEQKIWKRLEYFKSLKNRRKKHSGLPQIKIGILGCMAERLKSQILEKEQKVDLVCGPDAYRDLPRMLAVTESGQTSVNVMLSLDETYSDVTPVRINENSPSAFVSIMRGCDNMCTYCIVPFTRGRERSRPMESIIDEIRALSEQGVKEVTLLGQNVNSYRDVSHDSSMSADKEVTQLSAGFRTVYKSKIGGRRFADLLDRVSLVDPEMRIRFTSPHPKDFPDEVLYLLRDRPNICNQIHLPAQSGSSRMLEVMGRGYTREAYLELVQHIRSILPGVALSSDFIAGFCGETEEDHNDTVSLMRIVKYNFAFCFPYSMRQKTRAHRRLVDDVLDEVKNKRHEELVTVFREEAERLNQREIGKRQLVLVEGVSKRSSEELFGRCDNNVKVIFPRHVIPSTSLHNDEDVRELKTIQSGDYVVAEITGATSQVMRGKALFHTTLSQYYKNSQFLNTAENRLISDSV